MNKRLQFIFFLCGCLTLIGNTQSWAGDASRIVRSSIFPGIGQLGDGMGEISQPSTLKGLGFIAAEALCITLAAGEWSQASASARETQYLQSIYRITPSYEGKLKTQNAWNEAYDQAARSKTLVYAYLGAAAGVWLLNIADILIFVPTTTQESSTLRPIFEKTVLTIDGDKAGLCFSTSF